MVDDVDTKGMQTVVKTLAKIGLSDEDNVRGFDLTVTGSGFNNGVTADVYVLSGNDAGVGHPGLPSDDNSGRRDPQWRRGNRCRQPYCKMYAKLATDELRAKVDDLDFSDNPAESCGLRGHHRRRRQPRQRHCGQRRQGRHPL